ncbi:cytosolic sulfotransferase 12-like [Prosopis cineraria]|uniref:cytosolic sulfotransferase 12-like n=1 Tax=Prosopis cineraria TaxID=364024 RepID=UPI00240EED72|nr:cytosolic sulfotransferase 12-like [Prosopis cineraria]
MCSYYTFPTTPTHTQTVTMTAENSKHSNVPKYLQKVKLTQENKQLIATLPCDVFGEPSYTFHQYDGFWQATKNLQGILSSKKHFKAHDSNILLVTLPKSGTTWLKALAYAILNRKIYYPTNSNLDEKQSHPYPLLTANPNDLVPFLEINLYIYKNIPDLSLFPSPRLLVSHMPYISLPKSVQLSMYKIVYLCRNPNDKFTSTWHFLKHLLPQGQQPRLVEETFEGFCEGRIPFGPFWNHILGYYKQSLERPNKVMFLPYEELKIEPVRILKNLAEFIRHGFTKEEEDGNVINDIVKLCCFENLSNLEVNKIGKLLTGEENSIYFRRGDVGDGENFLTSDMIEKLNFITQEKLEKNGLNFQIHKS